jgi:methionyl-tRNA synthetase
VLFEAAEAVRAAATLLLPVIPTSATEILRRLGDNLPVADVRLGRDGGWRNHGERSLQAAPVMWPRTDLTGAETPAHVTTTKKERTVDETAAPTPAAPAPAAPASVPAAAPADARIAIDDFMKVELRAAKILAAEAVPKSKKLIQLTVDVGEAQPRTIVAGIAEGYQPADLPGKMIAIVANLKPAKLMGIESNGMVLAASPEGGAPILVAVDERVAPGTRVR